MPDTLPPPKKQRIVRIAGQRLWLFPQIQGDAVQLETALTRLTPHLAADDGLVFLGSQIGQGGQNRQVVQTLLTLGDRLALPIVWLRGVQEELLIRLLTIHLAPEPASVLDWMDREHALGMLLESLDVDLPALQSAANQGAAPLAQALKPAREAVQPLMPYLDACARAAINDQGQVLMVHGGVDPARPLSLQTDAFWWGHPDFFRMTAPYARFSMVYSARTPASEARVVGPGRLAFDSGAGRGGALEILCIDAQGAVLPIAF